MNTIERGRRAFITTASATLLVAATGRAAEADEKVGPGEDLMREHGVLRRVMLVYDEAIRRLAARETLPLGALAAGATIIRRVIEDYHEKLEEDFLFPHFERAGKLTELVATLRTQHKAGRRVTAEVLRLAHEPLAEVNRKKLADILHAFTRMYRPHAAREDTVLFPAFHALVGEKAYGELGEQFEDKEQSVLGKGGFEKAVEEVGRLETAFDIHDLARFTP
jgi:hemerythrin-like domain-containing protein